MTTIDNRVLSVSYGSFSVRLEGFDDPFAILRRVTEYFRSVSAVDPTFGQKPLTEDIGILEAMEADLFNDDICLSTEGSTITLTPKEGVVQPDVFVLDNSALAPADNLSENTGDAYDETQFIGRTITVLSSEQQITLVNTPLDLREMVQNHKKIPFVGKGPQALNDAETEIVRETVIEDVEEILVKNLTEEFAEPQTAAEIKHQAEDVGARLLANTEELSVENKVDEYDSKFIDAVMAKIVNDTLKAAGLTSAETAEEDDVSSETLHISDVDNHSIMATPDVKTETAPKFRSLSLNGFDKPQTPTQDAMDIKAMLAEYSQVTTVDVKPDVTAEAEETDISTTDLHDQQPVVKNPLRIIRNEYAYEEPTNVETPSASVNPFRKFPKRDAEPAPVKIPVASKEEIAESDFSTTYRKLTAEVG